MTVDELVTLTESLLGGMTVKDFRFDADDRFPDLTDDEFVLVVRFLAGERPTERCGLQHFSGPPVRRDLPPALTAEQFAAKQLIIDELEHEDDAQSGPKVLKGEFNGITLP